MTRFSTFVFSELSNFSKAFLSQLVTQSEKIENLVTNLIRKAFQSNGIPTKLVKEFRYLFPKYIAASINRCIIEGTFVKVFKKAEVRPIYKKYGRT